MYCKKDLSTKERKSIVSLLTDANTMLEIAIKKGIANIDKTKRKKEKLQKTKSV